MFRGVEPLWEETCFFTFPPSLFLQLFSALGGKEEDLIWLQNRFPKPSYKKCYEERRTGSEEGATFIALEPNPYCIAKAKLLVPLHFSGNAERAVEQVHPW